MGISAGTLRRKEAQKLPCPPIQPPTLDTTSGVTTNSVAAPPQAARTQLSLGLQSPAYMLYAARPPTVAPASTSTTSRAPLNFARSATASACARRGSGLGGGIK